MVKVNLEIDFDKQMAELRANVQRAIELAPPPKHIERLLWKLVNLIEQLL